MSRRKTSVGISLFTAILLFPAIAFAAGEDPSIPLLLYLVVILEDALRPLVELLAPIFFVQMGAKVILSSFASTDALWLALALTVAAITGKQLCSLGVIDRTVNR